MKILNDKNRINDNEVINIAEWKLPHDILNPSKHTKNIKVTSPYSTWMYEYTYGKIKIK